jgi:hypothetical protein
MPPSLRPLAGKPAYPQPPEKGFRIEPSGHGSPGDLVAIELHGPRNREDSRGATTQPPAYPSAANAGLVGEKAPGQADRKREQELDGTGKRDQEEVRLCPFTVVVPPLQSMYNRAP